MTGLRLADFAGTWRVERRISDFLARTGGRFDGTADFAANGSGMIYREDGELRFGGARAARAGREHLWSEADGRIFVEFPDGRAFHDFAPGPAAEAAHFCAPDEYRVAYRFSDWPRWSAVWRARGPRKDYRMVTFYSRD